VHPALPFLPPACGGKWIVGESPRDEGGLPPRKNSSRPNATPAQDQFYSEPNLLDPNSLVPSGSHPSSMNDFLFGLPPAHCPLHGKKIHTHSLWQ